MDPALILGLLSMAVRSCASPVQNSPAVDGGQAGIKRQFAVALALKRGPRQKVSCCAGGPVCSLSPLFGTAVDMDRITIELGILDISSRTCVKFVPRTHEDDFLDIQPHSGCWSYLGRTGGAQTLSLQSPGCMWSGVVSHELMHALGFVHEQSRSDRNRYVTIKWENIVEGQEHNFKKYETNNLKTPYDYGSIMHYGRYAFSEDGDPTIVPKPDPRTPIGQRDGPSATDLHKINLLYNCGEQRLSSVSSFSGHSAQWSTIALDTQPLSTLIW
ncbi:high choriolytic enzyme 1-like [Scleropages formosus]|uniref:Metalloendopeptidase n=1 Tax=Scleropages formosus TaxID=113540 RepID=A0A0P7T7S0_SCLFO|nr:high choriolytic enzyme 1-like [Scleropages formosus]